MKQDNPQENKGFGKMIIILIALLVVSVIVSFFLAIDNGSEVLDYNTAKIKISGPLYTSSSDGLFEDTTSSEEIVELMEKASEDSRVKAVLLEINSPGGSPVATDEISQAVKMLSEKNITTVAWIRELGASGAYWVASSSDHIVTSRMSIVGSIGVYGSYLEWYGLMNRYNVTYRRLVSGEYKDAGTPFRPMSGKEEELIQAKLDKLHSYFIEAVSTNRNMSIDAVTKLATGEIFLGIEAKENGLVDELGGKEEALKFIELKLGEEVKIKEFNVEKSFLESLMSAMSKNSYYMGKGISSMFLEEQGLQIVT